MRILLTVHSSASIDSGASGSVLELADAYRSAGHEVAVFSYDDVSDRVSGRLLNLAFPGFTARRIWRARRDVDVVDASTGDAWLWAATAGRVRGGRCPLLVTRSHGLEHIAHQMRLREASEDNLQLSWRYPLFHGGFRLWEVKRSLGGADLIFFLNGEERRFAIDKLGVRAEHSHVVHNGLPDHLIGLPSPAEPAADEVRRLAMVGSFSQRKGVAYAVPALTAVLRDRPPVELSLLGTKIPSAEAYGAFPADVRARIHVVRSYRREELPSLLEGHQIAVSASLAEGFGKATLEAMACGLAPIATDIAGPTEFIHDGDNGVLVAPGDPDALRDAALHLLDAPAELTRLRWAAHGSAQTFGWKAVAAQRLSLYEAGLRRRGEAL